MAHIEGPLISVVLCTYNRCELMAAALRSLYEQTMSPSRYEVIVVDNNSTDHTKQLVTEVSRHQAHVLYCFEAKQGLSHSRNTGFRAARGRYVAYIDDDCLVPKDWLAIAQEIIERMGFAFFGGPYVPFYNSPKPQWYRDRYGSYDCGPTARALTSEEYLTGTNMFIRRALLEQLGGFSSEVGMTGQRLGYGEEIAIQRRYRRECSGAVIHYDPRLGVSHLVRPEKMKLVWCAHHMFTIGRDWQRVLNQTREHRSLGRALFRSCRALLKMARALMSGALRDRSRYPFVENYAYEVAFVELRAMGMAYAELAWSGRTMPTASGVSVAAAKPAVRRFIRTFNSAYKRLSLRRRINRSRPLNVMLGAGTVAMPGWLATDSDILDVTSSRAWKRLFARAPIDRLMAEHLFEHLSDDECQAALSECFRYLRSGGVLRIAVPDGNRRDAEYVQEVSPPKDGHRLLFTVDDLRERLARVGFTVTPLEYFDANEEFHCYPWQDEDGLIRRSARHDVQERFKRGSLYYTSLIVDATKP